MATAIFEQLINGAMMGSIYVLMALGMVLIFGVMQVLNFAHGVLFMIGGYFTHLFFFHVTGSYPLSIIFSMLRLALIGMVLERAIFRALRQNLRMQIVASLGLILIIQNGVIQLWGPAALQMRTSSVSSLVKIGQLSFTVQHFVIIAVVAAAVVTLYLFLMRTRLGTAMRATSQHPEAAVVVGINPNRVYSTHISPSPAHSPARRCAAWPVVSSSFRRWATARCSRRWRLSLLAAWAAFLAPSSVASASASLNPFRLWRSRPIIATLSCSRSYPHAAAAAVGTLRRPRARRILTMRRLIRVSARWPSCVCGALAPVIFRTQPYVLYVLTLALCYAIPVDRH